MRPATSLRRRALTLIELVVVLAILVALSGMVVPLIDGLGHQTNSSTNATVVGDVNKAIRTFQARSDRGQYPNLWDSLTTTAGVAADLHDVVVPLLQPLETTTTQAASLVDAGIYRVYDAAGLPREIAAKQIPLAALNTTSTSFTNDTFNVHNLDNFDPANQFVVLGLGPNVTLRGTVMTDVPLISSADPNQNYARVLCVFMIPGSGTDAESFPAKYVGCFLPDGTSLRNNLDKYNNSAASD
jgi:prepilin-type N-terminal cleavage/methylation domain-containing protein